MRHNPNRNRFSFGTPLKRQLWAWTLIVLAPFACALFRWPAGALFLAVAAILQKRQPHNDDLADDIGDGIAGIESSRY